MSQEFQNTKEVYQYKDEDNIYLQNRISKEILKIDRRTLFCEVVQEEDLEQKVVQKMKKEKKEYSCFIGIVGIKMDLCIFCQQDKTIQQYNTEDLGELRRTTAIYISQDDQKEHKICGKHQIEYECYEFRFLLYGNKVYKVCDVLNDPIYAIISIEQDFINVASIQIPTQVQEYIQNIKFILEKGCYFSSSYDLTFTRQQHSQKSQMAKEDRFKIQDSYWFNRNMLQFLHNNSYRQNKNQSKDIEEILELKKQKSSEYKVKLIQQKRKIDKWFLKIIQGSVQYFNESLYNENGERGQFYEEDFQNVEFLLISRRNVSRIGSFYHQKGMDYKGHCANNISTEQIMINKDYLYSNVSLQCDPPVFFGQEGKREKLDFSDLGRDLVSQGEEFKKFYEDLHKQFQNIFAVSYLTNQDEDEKQILNCLKNVVKLEKLKYLRQENFDYELENAKKQKNRQKLNSIYTEINNYQQRRNTMIKIKNIQSQNQIQEEEEDIYSSEVDMEMQNMKFIMGQMNGFIKKIQSVSLTFGYFKQHLESGSIMNIQKGVIQTLVVKEQSGGNILGNKIGGFCIENMMNDFGIELTFPILDYFDGLCNNEFWTKYKMVGKQNQYILSKNGYNFDGHRLKLTTQLINDEILLQHFYKGRQTFKDFYQNCVGELILHNCYQLMTGNQSIYIEQERDKIENLQQNIIEQQSSFLKTDKIRIAIVTWNINAYMPQNQNENFQDLFDWEGEQEPDFVVFAIQELVKLKIKNMIAEINYEAQNTWTNTIINNLNKKKHIYQHLDTKNLVGLCMCVFVKQSLFSQVQKIDHDIIKTGMGGNLGNKGGIVIRIKFRNKKLCFLNCHLPAGDKHLQDRVDTIETIHQQAFQKETTPKHQKEPINESGVRFLIGDLNFRNTIKYNDLIQMVEDYKQANINKDKHKANELFQTILNSDTLKQLIVDREPALKGYNEGPINFLPTYKFDFGTDIYDTSKKRRIPSWCDRILIAGSDKLSGYKQKYYKSHPKFLTSDHKPVSSYYVLQFEEFLEEERLIQGQKMQSYYYEEKFDSFEGNQQRSESVVSNIKNYDFINGKQSGYQRGHGQSLNLTKYRGQLQESQNQNKNSDKFFNIQDIVKDSGEIWKENQGTDLNNFENNFTQQFGKEDIKQPRDIYKFYNNISIHPAVSYENKK